MAVLTTFPACAAIVTVVVDLTPIVEIAALADEDAAGTNTFET